MPNTSRFLEALHFAAFKHRDQRRKGAEAAPYINHPIAVARVLASEGGVTDRDVLMAALLHDTIEDTDTTAEDLRTRFGDRVAALVQEMSDDTSLRQAERKRLQIAHAEAKSPDARLIMLADKICTIRDVAAHPPLGWSLGRRREYFDWAKAVVDRLRGTNAALEAAFDEAYAKRPAD